MAVTWRSVHWLALLVTSTRSSSRTPKTLATRISPVALVMFAATATGVSPRTSAVHVAQKGRALLQAAVRQGVAGSLQILPDRIEGDERAVLCVVDRAAQALLAAIGGHQLHDRQHGQHADDQRDHQFDQRHAVLAA